MSVKITCETPGGGAAKLGKATASYAVAGVADLPVTPLFYGWVPLPNGKQAQLFVNSETGLIVVDVVNRGGKSGTEILRRIAK